MRGVLRGSVACGARSGLRTGIVCCAWLLMGQCLTVRGQEILDVPDTDRQFSERTVEILEKGSSSRSLIQSAQDQIPLAGLNADQRARVDGILQNRSMFRRLPALRVDADPEVYSYFIRNPESAVGIWKVLGISEFTLSSAGPEQWLADAGDGSSGKIEVLLRSPTQHLLLCDGQYKCPLVVRPIRAQALMHLRTRSQPNADGGQEVVHDLDLFVTFPSQTIDTISKAISPVSNAIADRNFRELSLFVAFMTYAMENQPGWIEQMAQRLDGITLDQRRELMEMSARVFVANRKRELQGAGIERASVEQIVAPFQQVTPAGGAGSAESPATTIGM